MKSILSYAAPLALAMSVNVATPTAAYADNGATDALSFCRYINPILIEQFPDLKLSLGRCVSFFRSSDVASLCKLFKDFEALSSVGFENQGQCVATLTKLS